MSGSLSRWSRRARTHARRVIYTLSLFSVGPPSRDTRDAWVASRSDPHCPAGASLAARVRMGNSSSEGKTIGCPIAGQGLLEREMRSGRKARQNTCPVTRVASWRKIIQGKTGLGDGQGIPVMPESRKRVLRGSRAPVPHERTGACRERFVLSDRNVMFVSLRYLA